MGFVTQTSNLKLRNEDAELEKVNALFSENAKRTHRLTNIMPTNRALLDKIHEFGFTKL
jgi:hypothetical protein